MSHPTQAVQTKGRVSIAVNQQQGQVGGEGGNCKLSWHYPQNGIWQKSGLFLRM